MKKYLIAFFFALVGLPAFATDFYYCRCDTGAHASCSPGVASSPGTAGAPQGGTFAAFIAEYKTAAVGSRFFFCQGGAWTSAASGNNVNNANTTKANPLIIDWYEDARWVGGAGTRPIFASASGSIFSFSQGTVAGPRTGYTIKNIHFDATGNANQTLLMGGQTGGLTVINSKFVGGSIGIQCNLTHSSIPTPPGTGISRTVTVRDSIFEDIEGMGILSGCDDVVIENSTFTRIGSANTDHAIYVSGGAQVVTPPTISSITGDGATVTVTTSAPHGFDPALRWGVRITSVTGGSGRFNSVSNIHELITITGDSTFTYYATGSGAATPGTIAAAKYAVDSRYATIRNNTFTDMSHSGAGNCLLAVMIVHGVWDRVLIENNTATETIQATDGRCRMLEIDSGQYYIFLEPEGYEAFDRFVVRNNSGVGHSITFQIDACEDCLIENNYGKHGYNEGTVFRVLRGRNGVPGAQFTGTSSGSNTAWTLNDTTKTFASVGQVKITGGTGSGQIRRITATAATQLTVAVPWTTVPDATSTYITASSTAGANPPDMQSPTRVILRYNTAHSTAPNTSTGYAPFVFNCQITDPDCGTDHEMYSNLAVIENVTSTSHHCFDTTNMTSGQFARRGDNSCYYVTSGAAATFDPNLGTTTGDVLAATLNVTSGQPFFTSAGTSPAVGASSAVLGAGTAGLKPLGAFGGFKRLKEPTDRGAFEITTTTPLPNPPARVTVE
jgi:hypothetical protein